MWRALTDPNLAAGVLLIGMLVLCGLVGPLVRAVDPNAVSVANALAPPSSLHPMGTDGAGRDVLARFFYGARISLAIAAIVVLLGTVVGGSVGVMSAVIGGWVDILFMRVIDVVLAFPPLILAMGISVGLGVGLVSATIGITLITVPYYARLIRSDVLRIQRLPHVLSAVAVGAAPVRVIWHHIIPHTIPTMLIQSAAVFGYAILTLAALGFVGLGAQIPTPEWGAMITNGLQYIVPGQWWVAVFPGLGVFVAVVGMNLIADRLRDVLDPHGNYGLM